MTTQKALMWPMRFAVFIIFSMVAAAAQGEPVRVEVGTFENGSELSPEDVDVLRGIIVSELSTLPEELFLVGPSSGAAQPDCGEPCQLEDAAVRGIDRLVFGSIRTFGDGFLGGLELHDVASGQLLYSVSTPVLGDLSSLVGEMKKAAAELKEKMVPDGEPAPEEQSVLVKARAVDEGWDPTGTTARLRVTTKPPGAKIFIQRMGNTESAGKAPIEKILKPLEYRVIARMADHEDAVQKVRLDPMETETLHLELTRIYLRSPQRKLGHILFWPGVGSTAFGFVALVMGNRHAKDYKWDLNDEDRDEARAWTGGMWAGLGVGVALMTSGIILWAVTPGDKEYWEKNHETAIVPVEGGGAVAIYGRRF